MCDGAEAVAHAVDVFGAVTYDGGVALSQAVDLQQHSVMDAVLHTGQQRHQVL